MRRFLTLVCLLCVAIPAGISISGCTRNPQGNFCNGLGYGLTNSDVASIFLTPQTSGISLAYGQTQQIAQPTAKTCKGTAASVTTYNFGTTNNQLVDVSPSGNLCAGTWNRNSGGGIPNYTICSFPNPIPTTGNLPYATVYITASADSVTSNPVAVYLHPQVTSVALVTEPVSGSAQQCFSQGTLAQLDAQACASANNKQYLLCAPNTVTSANSACPMPSVTPDILASGTFVSVPNIGSVVAANYVSGGTITGTQGQTCLLSGFNGANGVAGTVTLTADNTIANPTAVSITAAGSGATAAPTTATLASGTATCSGTATITSALGPIAGTAGETCTLTSFNNGLSGGSATVTLSSNNAISNGTPLTVTAGGLGATAPPTTAVLSNGTAACAGTATVTTTLTPVQDCSSVLGTLNYQVGTPSVASINAETNQITAELPGTTVITALSAGGSSSAGYFSTCPPRTINVTLANGATSGTVTQGVTQNLTTTVYDTNINASSGLGNPITGLTLDYQSTDPIDVEVGSQGAITTSFPGVASVFAICQPTSCNPAPINETGLYGTGLSIASNPVTITVPGTASDYVWFASPGQSQYFVPIELLSGTVGSTVRLPFVPNSMLMDRAGVDLYFGSAHELMYYSTSTNTLIKQDPNAPGVILAASPAASQLLINDQIRQVFYLYNTASGSSSTFGGMGTAAQWTPDAKTLYITDSAAAGPGHTDTLYVYNVSKGWTSTPLTPSGGANPGATNVAITIPGVGAYMSGSPTVAHTWCPAGPVGGSPITYYPQGDSVNTLTDVLAATTDGQHILGAALSGGAVTLSDIGITLPTITSPNGDLTPAPCTVTAGVMKALPITHTFTAPIPVSGVTATAVNQVVPSPQSKLAFITYDGTTAGATLPYYIPGSGTVNYVTLNNSGSVTAPLVGAFSPDDSYFFVGTAGDNLVHYITIPATVTTATPPTDTQQIAPNLPACIPVSAGGNDPGCTYTGTGSVVPVTAIAVKPRSTT
jgi:hypothetical protein